MAYSALGMTGDAPISRLQAALLGRGAQRTGPVMRAARAVSGGARPPSRREQMENRYARKAAQERLAEAFNAAQAREAEKHSLSMDLGRERLGQVDFDRDLALRRQSETERRGDTEADREARLFEAMQRQLGLAETGAEFERGPAFGLEQRKQTELERSNKAREALDMSKRSGMDPEQINRTIFELRAAMYQAATPQERALYQQEINRLQRMLSPSSGDTGRGSEPAPPAISQSEIAQIIMQNPGEIARLLSEDKTGQLLRQWAEVTLPGVSPRNINLALERALDSDEFRQAYAAVRYPKPAMSGIMEGFGRPDMVRRDWVRNKLGPTLREEFQRHLAGQ